MGSLGFAFVPAGALAAAFPGPRVLPLSRGTAGGSRTVAISLPPFLESPPSATRSAPKASKEHPSRQVHAGKSDDKP